MLRNFHGQIRELRLELFRQLGNNGVLRGIMARINKIDPLPLGVNEYAVLYVTGDERVASRLYRILQILSEPQPVATR